jgi:hypothetical protein
MIKSPEYQNGFIAGFIAATQSASRTPVQAHSQIKILFEEIQRYFDTLIKDTMLPEGQASSRTGAFPADLGITLQLRLDFDKLLDKARLVYEAKVLRTSNQTENEQRDKHAAEVAAQQAEIARLEAEADKTELRTRESRDKLVRRWKETEDLKSQKLGLDREISKLRIELTRLLSQSEELDIQRKILLAKQEQEKLQREAEDERQREYLELAKQQAERLRLEGSQAEIQREYPELVKKQIGVGGIVMVGESGYLTDESEFYGMSERLKMEAAERVRVLKVEEDKEEMEREKAEKQRLYQLGWNRHQIKRARRQEFEALKWKEGAKEEAQIRAVEGQRKLVECRLADEVRQRFKGGLVRKKREAEKADAVRLREMNHQADMLRKEIREEELVAKYQERWADASSDG